MPSWTDEEIAGAALRRRRNDLGHTQDKTADRVRRLSGSKDASSFSKASVSRLEAGKVDPRTKPKDVLAGWGYYCENTVRSLVDSSYVDCSHDVVIARGFGKDLRTPKPGRPNVDLHGARIAPHGARLELLRITLEPGSAMTGTLETHLGEEIVIVTDGQIAVTYQRPDSDEEVVENLSVGDVVHFNSETPHRLGNGGDSVAEALLIKHPPDRYSRHSLEEELSVRKKI